MKFQKKRPEQKEHAMSSEVSLSSWFEFGTEQDEKENG